MDHDDVLTLMQQPLGDILLVHIGQAYRVCAAAHCPAIGNNAMTFGMSVRFAIEKFLDEALVQYPEVTISRPAGSYQLAYDGHVFHFYKFGMVAGDSVDQLTFDDSTTKMSIIADNQLPLPGIPKLRHWIVAHSGNPEQGLLEIFIGAPHSFGHLGSPWAWRHQVYAALGDHVSGSSLPGSKSRSRRAATIQLRLSYPPLRAA